MLLKFSPDSGVFAVAHCTEGLDEVELPEFIHKWRHREGDDLCDEDDEDEHSVVDLQLLAEEWNDDHEADGVADVDDDAEGGVVGLVEGLEDQSHVKVNHELGLDAEPVKREPKKL